MCFVTTTDSDTDNNKNTFLFTIIIYSKNLLVKKCSKMMKQIYKSIQRLAFDTGLQNKRLKLFIYIIIVILLYTIFIYKIGRHKNDMVPNNTDNICDTFDVVYTWVNGSDPIFQKLLKKYYNRYSTSSTSLPLSRLSSSSSLLSSDYDPSRFDDKNELKFSLRSLERYAPWIRHVYIVTNGQIPHWLDISYDKVTIIQHSQLIDDNVNKMNILPTFSSSSIETFIHRIPNLSKRFLYMNDDIFLGKHLYPEDLYTESDGVKIYNAWTLPDCAIDCPWVYIGDGSCDHHCNIDECQYDGGDCIYDDSNINSNTNNNDYDSNILLKLNNKSSNNYVINSTMKQQIQIKERKSFKNFSNTIAANNNIVATNQINSNNKSIFYKNSDRKILSFNEILKKNNVTNIHDIQKFVEQYNNEKRKIRRIKRMKKYLKYRKRYSVENGHDYKEEYQRQQQLQLQQQLLQPSPSSSSLSTRKFTSTKEMFSHSLLYTNKLLNKMYGFKSRNVLAHVGFLFDKDIINEMQMKFSNEIMKTQLNRFRNKNDIQFAFLYYNYLMSETINISINDIFNEFDTDKSLTWSDREIRTVLSKLYTLPLDWSIMHYFEDIITNCSTQLHLNEMPSNEKFTTILYERYEDSNIPTVSKYLVSKCWPLADALLMNFGKRSKYKYTINQKRGLQSNFMMLTSNITEVAENLDKFRRDLKKFNCINDNLEPQYDDDNQFIKYLLDDFYLSLFPIPSKFELPSNLRNRFTYLNDYNEWLKIRKLTIFFSYLFSIIIILYLLYRYCLCFNKLLLLLFKKINYRKGYYNRQYLNM